MDNYVALTAYDDALDQDELWMLTMHANHQNKDDEQLLLDQIDSHA